MNLLFPMIILILAGFVGSKVAQLFHVPDLIGYLVGGVIVGPYALGFISLTELSNLQLMTDLALTFISFEIGLEFRFKSIKKLGTKPLLIALISAVATFFLITTALLFVHASFPFALLLGTIGASTAPTSILAIVKKEEASGVLTRTMLSVVALDDLISIVLFGFATAFVATPEDVPTILLYLRPFYEIAASLLIGIGSGFLLSFVLSKKKAKEINLLWYLLVLFGLMVISERMEVDSLLVAMVAGIVFTNLSKPRKVALLLDTTSLIRSLFVFFFFVLSGAYFNIQLLPQIGFFCLVFMVARTIGKLGGAFLGAKVTKSSKKIKQYLGFTLLSELGITVGLASIAASHLGPDGEVLQAIVLVSGILFEVLAIGSTKFALRKSGEIGEKKKRRLEKKRTLYYNKERKD